MVVHALRPSDEVLAAELCEACVALLDRLHPPLYKSHSVVRFFASSLMLDPVTGN